jgi:DNA-binding MarR family transcriptional regulator
MARDASTPYRFGDLLALARRAWVLRMAREMDARGYPGYKISDAATVRTLLAGAAPVGAFAGALGVSRQAARKVARGLERRGYATAERDASDARRVNISLTPRGVAYARAVTAVIRQLNLELADAVTAEQLAAVDAVLRAALENEPRLKPAGARIPRPREPER